MKEKPYIGITGFKTQAEVEETAKLFDKYLPELGQLDKADNWGVFDIYTAMFGFLVSNKKLSNWDVGGDKSPAAINLKHLALLVPGEYLPMMHYYTPNRNTLSDEVITLFNKNDMYKDNACRALQINQDWPEIFQIHQIKKQFPEMKIVLQLPKRATNNLSLNDILNLTSKYSDLVDYGLIDPSGGLGQDFDTFQSVLLMNELSEVLPSTRIGVAGGLSGDNVKSKIIEIKNSQDAWKIDTDFCIDAQGKLRVNVFGESLLSPEKVKNYIEQASQGLSYGRKNYR